MTWEDWFKIACIVAVGIMSVFSLELERRKRNRCR